MDEDVEYGPLVLQTDLYRVVTEAWADYYKAKVGAGGITCDENDKCYDCPWTNVRGCQMEHFELVIMK